MIIEVDFDFMIKHKLNIEQYMLCYVLEEDRKSLIGDERIKRKSGSPIALIYKYTENIRTISIQDMEDLIERGYLTLTGDKYTPDMLDVTDKFKRELFTHWSNFEQLFEIYPDRMRLGPGQPSVSLKSLDKPIEEMGEYYASIVRTNKKHEQILEITKWAKEKGLISMGIQKYVYSRHWERIEDQYELGVQDEDDTEVLI